MEQRRILIVKIGAIGDVIMALPMVTAARDLFPSCHITWMCGRTVEPLLNRISGIDVVLGVDERAIFSGRMAKRLIALASAIRPLAARSFDLVAIGHTDWRYRAFSSLSLAKNVRQFRRSPPFPVPGRHHTFEYVRLITQNDGPEVSTYSMPDFAPEEGETLQLPEALEDLILLAPGGATNVLAAQPLKKWPLQHYVALARMLVGGGYKVGLIGGPNDQSVVPEFDGINVIDFVGKTSLKQLTSLMTHAALIISHDTSAIHLSQLARTPTLALFGPTLPSQFLFPSRFNSHIWGGDGLACRPCYDGRAFFACSDNVCMKSIAPEIVMKEVEDLLKAVNSAGQ
jgi:heptosyltransferase-2